MDKDISGGKDVMRKSEPLNSIHEIMYCNFTFWNNKYKHCILRPTSMFIKPEKAKNTVILKDYKKQSSKLLLYNQTCTLRSIFKKNLMKAKWQTTNSLIANH